MTVSNPLDSHPAFAALSQGARDSINRNRLAEQRKWTVEVTVGGVEIPVDLDDILIGDTLRDVTRAGKDVAEQAINDEIGSDASVVLYKRLAKDPEPKRDRRHYGYRDWNGSGTAVIVWQYTGA